MDIAERLLFALKVHCKFRFSPCALYYLFEFLKNLILFLAVGLLRLTFKFKSISFFRKLQINILPACAVHKLKTIPNFLLKAQVVHTLQLQNKQISFFFLN